MHSCTIEIVDELKAKTRRRRINYVREGNTLIHISRYASEERGEKG